MEDYDVLVVGGGVAGFCAAVAAARGGAKTALLEKYPMPGGTLTVLGSASVDQFNNPFLKQNKMVILGIGWEYVLRLYRDGFATMPDMDAPYRVHWQYGVKVNQVAGAKVMDDMLLESGVHLYYGQPVVEAQTAGTQLRAVRIFTGTALQTLTARVYIDCTGDGDLAVMAGARTVAGDGNGHFQPGTIRFYPATDAKDAVLDEGDNQNHVSLHITDSAQMTQAQIEARRMLYEQMQKGERIMACAPAVGPREGRRIVGVSCMQADDYCSGRVFADSVCYSYWFVDIHRDNEPAYIQYIRHGHTPTVRYSAMLCADVENLMMAGRCISSDRATNSALRVKASCMAMGEVCGTAAALAVKQLCGVREVPLSVLKQTLAANGAIVPAYTPTVSFRDALER